MCCYEWWLNQYSYHFNPFTMVMYKVHHGSSIHPVSDAPHTSSLCVQDSEEYKSQFGLQREQCVLEMQCLTHSDFGSTLFGHHSIIKKMIDATHMSMIPLTGHSLCLWCCEELLVFQSLWMTFLIRVVVDMEDSNDDHDPMSDDELDPSEVEVREIEEGWEFIGDMFFDKHLKPMLQFVSHISGLNPALGDLSVILWHFKAILWWWVGWKVKCLTQSDELLIQIRLTDCVGFIIHTYVYFYSNRCNIILRVNLLQTDKDNRQSKQNYAKTQKLIVSNCMTKKSNGKLNPILRHWAQCSSPRVKELKMVWVQLYIHAEQF